MNRLVRLEREVDRLREENARLKSLLEQHGIDGQAGAGMDTGRGEPAIPLNSGGSTHVSLPAAEKVALFRRLFRGRTDVYPIRWESQSGKSGYSPACANEWRPGICEKPRIKCAACSHRQLIPVTDPVIYDHLAGKHIIGVYPLLADDTCYFLAVDFDEADWRGDAKAFLQACRELEVPAALEISRSGQGAHVWIFFTQAVPARDTRRLGSAIITYTCAPAPGN